MQNLIKRLEKRGWSKKEILEAVEKMHKAKQLKTLETRFLEKHIYWILLIVIIAANFAISVALIPILMVLKGIFLYFVIITLGIVFGLLFELVIRSIEHLEKHHHLILAILIPIIALVNVFAITIISNNLVRTLNLTALNRPTSIALVYAASFALPYIVYRFILKIEYYVKG